MEKKCFHCSLPVPESTVYFANVAGAQQPMCCPGCKAVTEAIVAGGLENYYQHRTSRNLQADLISQRLREELGVYDREDIQKDFVQALNNGNRQASLLIEGITCAACIWLLEKHLSSLEGVEQVQVNLSTHEAQIIWQPDCIKLSAILIEIQQIGYKAFPWQADRQEALLKQENRTFIRRLAVAGIGAMQVMMYAVALYFGAITNDMTDMYRDLIRIMSAIVATPVILYSAAPFFKTALRDLNIKHLSMDVPVSIAIAGAYTASLWATYTGRGEVYFDSVCMFTFFLLTGRYFELRARHATVRSARALTNVLPASCLKKTDHLFNRVPVADLQPDDIVRVLPGDVIPADGTILSGITNVNESMLSGEYMPIEKHQGDNVLCGSINTGNAIELKIIHVGQQTRMAGIIQLLQRAQQDKPAIAIIADKVAAWFVAGLLLTAIIVYWAWSGIAPQDAFWITLSVLVVTCPCALSLATPAALTAATGHLHKLGLLITRGHVLEGLNRVDHIVFDKTGTLTKGELTLTETRPLKPELFSAKDCLILASALEIHSEHPIARAFQQTVRTIASNIKNHTGQGLEGIIEGQQYRIGRPDFACPDRSPEHPQTLGQWLLLSCEREPLCWFKITDTLRPEARHTINQLQKLGKKITLLSGDTESVVAATAKSTGILHWQSAASPDDKLSFIRTAQSRGECILMIGDGINDVPVLAGADISLAMGNASDLARTSSDAVLISSDLGQLLKTLDIAQQTRKIIRQNLAWALIYNLTALPLAAMGMIPPWMAALGMALSSLLVVANALRLSYKQNRNSKASEQNHEETVSFVDV